MIGLLIKENEAVKKCLNQMIQTADALAEKNNEMYFEDHESEDSFSGES